MNWTEGQFILIDKPRAWSSFDVVKKIRNRIKVKIGHAGTLDPLATGLLILATGKFTKKIEEVQALSKVYEGIIGLGKTTPSFDLETNFDTEISASHVKLEQINSVIKSKFLGEIEQIPPRHSAVKLDGVRAYKKARKNEEMQLRSRKVQIHDFEITNFENSEISFRIHCAKGTYIRSISHDLGQALKVGGYLKKLRRVKIGDFHVSAAYTLDDFLTKFAPDANH